MSLYDPSFNTKNMLHRKRFLPSADDDEAGGRHNNSPEENNVESDQVLTFSPTQSPTSVQICYPDQNGNFGVIEGSSVSSAPLQYNYEIETKPFTDGVLLVEKVEKAISAKILSDFFSSCKFPGLRRQMKENEEILTGFSSNPNDVVNESGCREKNPINGNHCTSIIGKNTIYAEEESIDYKKAKIRAIESIMYAMANDELIHIDENIVKINFVPAMDQQPVKKANIPEPPAKAINVESSSFNKAYLAFVPFGVVCFIFLLYVIKRQKNSRNFRHLSDEGDSILGLSSGHMNCKDTKLERLSSVADSVKSDYHQYVNPVDNSSESTSPEDPEISYCHSVYGFEVSLAKTPEK